MDTDLPQGAAGQVGRGNRLAAGGADLPGEGRPYFQVRPASSTPNQMFFDFNPKGFLQLAGSIERQGFFEIAVIFHFHSSPWFWRFKCPRRYWRA